MFVLVIFCMTHSATEAILQITDHEYPLMDGIKHISDELFTTGQPLFIILPLVEENSTKSEVDYLIKELHTASRWPIIVMNVTYGMNKYMRFELIQPGNYVILISGNCRQYTVFVNNFRKQLSGLSESAYWQTRNTRARFVIAVMTPCDHYDNKFISKDILRDVWTVNVTNALVVFKEQSGQLSKFHQGNISESVPQIFLSLHKLLPYENSHSCVPNAVDVPMQTFIVQDFSTFEYSRIHERFPVKNFHGCQFRLFVVQSPPYVLPPDPVKNKDSQKGKLSDREGLDIQMIKAISKSLNLSFRDVQQEEYLLGHENQSVNDFEHLFKGILYSHPDVIIGGLSRFIHPDENFDVTHSYYNVRFYWQTPCAIKYRSWDRIFKTFSMDIWIVVSVLLVFVVISVHFISFYGQKLNINEYRTYGNVASITSNIIAIALGVSVVTKPRTTPLRVFFVSWVCYSVTMSTVFQAFFTTYLIEPGYEEPIKNKHQLLHSGGKFCGPLALEDLSITGTVDCSDDVACLDRARLHQNISTVTSDYVIEYFKHRGFLTDENNRPLLCELEDGNVKTDVIMIVVSKGNILLESINDVIIHAVEADLPNQWKKLLKYSVNYSLNTTSSHTLADKYVKFNVTHFQAAFYVLLLGYILSLLCFNFEITRNPLKNAEANRCICGF